MTQTDRIANIFYSYTYKCYDQRELRYHLPICNTFITYYNINDSQFEIPLISLSGFSSARNLLLTNNHNFSIITARINDLPNNIASYKSAFIKNDVYYLQKVNVKGDIFYVGKGFIANSKKEILFMVTCVYNNINNTHRGYEVTKVNYYFNPIVFNSKIPLFKFISETLFKEFSIPLTIISNNSIGINHNTFITIPDHLFVKDIPIPTDVSNINDSAYAELYANKEITFDNIFNTVERVF